ncbi:MAG: hypothetical protein RL757_2897 [Bacteroidota bacterium]|jgi:ABC-type Mn2+/Zn2+ transport system permease subunit/Mn-dependent DtxR family transcriptional regulator
MADFLNLMSQTWAIRALCAAGLVGIMCGVLGCFIVLRNMSLIGDALSHAVLPGVVVAFLLVGLSTFGFFVGAVVAGLLAALLITWIQQNVRTKNDAAIGIVFTAMFSLGVMGISWLSHGQGVHLDLKDFLFGNILGVSDADLWLTLGVAILVISSVALFYRYLFVTTFQSVVAQVMGISVQTVHYFLMLLLSFSIVAALRTVGVILVVAMLITPASTALLLSDRLRNVLWISGLMGALSAILGFVAAVLLETTPGPAMCVVATLLYFLTVLFAPKKGFVRKLMQKQALKQRIELEDVLKGAMKLDLKNEPDNGLNFENLAKKLTISDAQLKKHLNHLKQQKLLQFEENTGQISLDTGGVEIASKLVRAHRLWETFLATEMGLSEEQVHEDADLLEHFLSEELLNEVDEHLGFPETDPHGSPIPKQ